MGASAPAVSGQNGVSVIRNHLDAAIAAAGRIVALVDPQKSLCRNACDRLKENRSVLLAEGIEDLPANIADIIVLATPARGRLEQVVAALRKKPKLLLLEKPVAESLGECAHILELAQDAGTHVFVSFNRRTDPGIQSFRRALAPTIPKAVFFRYGNGLMNYGSHAVDHIIDWFGAIKSVQSAPCGDSDPNSSCVSFRCEMRSGLTVNVLGIPDIVYDMFELEIFYPESVLGFRNNGVDKFRFIACDDLHYPGYAGLIEADPPVPPSPIGGFVEMYKELFASVSGKVESSLCTGAQAYEGLRVLMAALQSSNEGGRVVTLSDIRPDISYN